MGKVVKIALGAAILVAGAVTLGIGLAAGAPLFGTFGALGTVGIGVAGFTLSSGLLLTIGGGLIFSAVAGPGGLGVQARRQLAENLSISSGALETRSIIFGRAGVAGQVIFRKNISNASDPPTTDDDPDEILIILALAGTPATALEKLWFNDELVFDGDTTTGPGAITSGKFANDLWVWFRTGEETTAAFPEIASMSSEWAAKTRILRGIPAVAMRIKVTQDLDGRLEPLFQVRGAKLYDPRKDDTVPGGAGAHRFDDPTTFEWSENPKLAELMYLRGVSINGRRIVGMGKGTDAIDLESFAAEANVCEEQVAVKGGGTIDRYTGNGVLRPTNDHRQNLQQILSASAGIMDASGGIYRTFAGAWRSPVMDLTEDDISDVPRDIGLETEASEGVNVIGGGFANPADRWAIREVPELRDQASIDRIGENRVNVDLPFTIDHRIAQRIFKIEMRRANARKQIVADYWLRVMGIQPGDIVTQQYTRYGFAGDTMRVALWGLEAREDRQGNRTLMSPMRLVEEQESWFEWDADMEEADLGSVTQLPPAIRAPRLQELRGTPLFLGSTPAILAEQRVGQVATAFDASTNLREGIRILREADGGVARLANGLTFGVGADGDSFTFPEPLPEIPRLRYLGGGASTPDPNGPITWPWSARVRAANATTSGFDLSAKFVAQQSTPTLETDTGSTSDGTGLVIEKEIATEADGDVYKCSFSGTVGQATEDCITIDPGGGESCIVVDGTATYVVDTRATSGSAWIERGGAKVFNNSSTSGTKAVSGSISVTVDGLGTDAAFRVRMKSGSPGSSLDGFSSVEYHIPGATQDIVETMSPAGTDLIEIEVLGGEEPEPLA